MFVKTIWEGYEINTDLLTLFKNMDDLSILRNFKVISIYSKSYVYLHGKNGIFSCTQHFCNNLHISLQNSLHGIIYRNRTEALEKQSTPAMACHT